MRYMLLIYLDEQSVSETEREHCYAESTQFAHQLNSSGHYLAAAPLHPTSTATSVRVREGKRRASISAATSWSTPKTSTRR